MRLIEAITLSIFSSVIFCAPSEAGSPAVSAVATSAESLANPNIIDISSGPIHWDANSGYRFRLVAVLSEVDIEIYFQKIEIGDEGCCAKIIKEFEFSKNKDDQSPHPLYSLSDITWNGEDVVTFIADEMKYKCINFSNNPTCKTLSPEKPPKSQ
jgi:hypothetical protein